MLLSRRKILTGLLAAPIVVRAGLIMPVKGIVKPIDASWLEGPFPAPSDWNDHLRQLMAAIRTEYLAPVEFHFAKTLGAYGELRMVP